MNLVKRKFILLCVAYLYIVSCASHNVSSEKDVSFTLQENFYTPFAGGEIHDPIEWADLFPSTKLATMLVHAHKNNFDIQKSWLRVNQAMVTRSLADDSRWWPDASLGLSQSKEIGTSKGDAASSANRAALNLSVAWELDVWRRLDHKAKSSKWLVRASIFEAHAFDLSVTGQIVDTWLQLRHHATITQLLSKRLVLQKQLYNIMLLNSSHGSVSALELAQEESRLLNLQQQIEQNDQQALQYENALALLVGMSREDLPGEWQPLFSEGEQIDMPSNKAITMMLYNRLDVQEQFSRLQSADYEVAAAIANYWPSVTLSFAQGLSGVALSSITDNVVTTGSVSIATQLLNFPTLRAAVKGKKLDLKIQYATFNQTVRKALKEVEDLLLNINSQENQFIILKQQVATSNYLVMRARSLYVSGNLSYKDLMQYEDDNFELRIKQVDLKRSLLVARKNLTLAVGMVDTPYPSVVSETTKELNQTHNNKEDK